MSVLWNYLQVILEFWKENWPLAIPFLILLGGGIAIDNSNRSFDKEREDN